MNRHIVPSIAAFAATAAVAAAALPEPSATLRLESISSLFDAATAIAAECAGPAVASQLVGGARQAVSGSGMVDDTKPVEAACWIGLSGDGGDFKAAALVSVPAGEAGSAGFFALIGAAPSEDGAPVPVDALPFPAAAAARDGKILLALVASDEAPDGVPGSPAAILGEAAGVFASEPLRADALLEGRCTGDLAKAKPFDAGSGLDLDDIAESLEEEFGISGAGQVLAKFFEAIAAESGTVRGVTFDVWVDPSDGLVLSTVADLEPGSGIAAASAGRAPVEAADLPADVGADAFVWAACSPEKDIKACEYVPELFSGLAAGAADQSRKDLLSETAEYCKKAFAAMASVKKSSLWIAPDSEGRPYTAIRIETADALAALKESEKSEQALAQKILPDFASAAGIAVDKTDDGCSVAIPVERTVSAIAAAVAKAADEEIDAGDAARISEAAKWLERLVGQTNVVAATASGDSVVETIHAAGAARPAGAPASPAAFALASRVPAGLAPVAVSEVYPSRIARAALKLYPEISAASPDARSMLFAGVPVSQPVRTLALADASRTACVTSVPMSELHFVANLVQIVVAARQSALGFDYDVLDDDDDDDDDDDED